MYFTIDNATGILNEVSDQRKYGVFASWYIGDLRQRISEKHNETFWVSVNVKDIDGQEYFYFTDVYHTRKPSVSQFNILLEQGAITMNHLISCNSIGRLTP